MNRYVFVGFVALAAMTACQSPGPSIQPARIGDNTLGDNRSHGFIPVNISFTINPVSKGSSTMGTVLMNDSQPKPLRTLNLTYNPASAVDPANTATSTTVPANSNLSLPFRVTPKLTAPSVIAVTATEDSTNNTVSKDLSTK